MENPFRVRKVIEVADGAVHLGNGTVLSLETEGETTVVSLSHDMDENKVLKLNIDETRKLHALLGYYLSELAEEYDI